MTNDNRPLTDAEYAEALRNHQIVKDAYARDPEATKAALMDAVRDMRDFPTQSGDLTT